MKTNSVQKTLTIFAHPVTLGMLGLLLVNDHLLRRLWPSWLTGKISDVAWLFIAPLLLHLLLGLLTPRLWLRAAVLLTILSYSLVGLVYTLGNTSAWFSALLVGAGEDLLHIPLAITVDPTDLLALPALLVSYLFWLHSKNPQRKEDWIRPVAAGAALLGAALTIANSAAPQYGVDGLELRDGKIIACTTFQSFASEDGGLHWDLEAMDYSLECTREWDGTITADLPDGERIFRYREEVHLIESSTDSGQTWQVEYTIRPVSEARQAAYRREFSANAFYRQGPLDGIFDPQSESLVFAMGMEGALVRTPDGNWRAVAVGEYAVREITLQSAVSLLGGEIILAVGLALLLVSTAGVRVKPKFYTIIPLVFAWVGWLGIGVLFSPALYDSYPIPLEMLFTALGVLLLPLSGFALYWLVKSAELRLFGGIAAAAGTMILYMLPFALWVQDVIKMYGTAMLLGLLVAAGGMVAVLLLRLKQAERAH